MSDIATKPRDALFSELLKFDPEFKKLYKSHQALETQLERMKRLKKLTDRDEMERKRIQKLKLIQKDQMEEILATAFRKRKKSVA